MSFVVKNSQLTSEAVQSINNLLEQDINAAVAFRLLRIVKHLSPIVDDKISSEKKIVDKWSQKDENGSIINAKDDDGNTIDGAVILTDLDAFSKDMSDLLNVENEIPFDKIRFEELNLQTIKLKDLMKIEFLFDVE